MKKILLILLLLPSQLFALTAGGIPYTTGNADFTLLPLGTASQVLSMTGSVPTWVATTTFSSPLIYSAGGVSFDFSLGQTYTGANIFNNITRSTTTQATTTNFAVSGVLNALHLANGTGGILAYGGTSCTNQFVRSLSALGVATCATVGAADASLANLTATDATLTFSGTYTGATARTIGLNLGQNNIWTASTTFPNIGFTTSTSTNATSTNSFSTTASSTNLFSSLVKFGTSLSVGTATPTLANTLNGSLNLGSNGASGSTTISVGKIQIDGYSNTGGRVCAFVVGTGWVIVAKACTQ